MTQIAPHSTVDEHYRSAEIVAGQAGDMLAKLVLEPGGVPTPHWSHALAYADALSRLAQVHATLACFPVQQ